MSQVTEARSSALTDYFAIVRAWLHAKTGSERIPANGTAYTLRLFVQIAGLLRGYGLDADGIHAELVRVNTELCDKPLKLAKFKSMGKWAERKWPAGHLDDEPHHAARRLIRELRQLADSLPLHGRTAFTDRKCILVILSIAQRNGISVVQISARDLAEHAGINKETASMALHRLTAVGWLKLLAASRKRHRPNLYLLLRPPDESLQNPYRRDTSCASAKQKTVRILQTPAAVAGNEPAAAGVSDRRTLLPLDADEFRSGKLGSAGAFVANALRRCTEPATLTQIAAAAGVHLSTASRALHRLETAGMATRDAKRQWQAAAPLVATYQRRDEQRAQHRAERVLHHVELAQEGHTDSKIPTPTLSADELVIVRRKAPGTFKRLVAHGLVPADIRTLRLVLKAAPLDTSSHVQPRSARPTPAPTEMTAEQIAARRAELRQQADMLRMQG